MLKNKLNITDEVELSKIEEKITKLKALELYDSGKINTIEVGTFKGLAQIHNYLFSDIYDFAGKMRTVNIAKGNFRFASVLYLKDILKTIDTMPEDNYDNIIKKYVEMNVAHPFREGNGRSPIKDTEINILLKNALTDKANDRNVYMKGIDASYAYEGYATYKLEDVI